MYTSIRHFDFKFILNLINLIYFILYFLQYKNINLKKLVIKQIQPENIHVIFTHIQNINLKCVCCTETENVFNLEQLRAHTTGRWK